MSSIATHQRASEADYHAIERAVMETERGRWFLSEFAARNRHADTETLLTALQRIERSVSGPRELPVFDRLRLDILEMSKAIARTHAEIALIRSEDDSRGPFVEASGELDSIVLATESATSEILAAAEQVQEAAWTMREAGVDPAVCDMLDVRATEIYTACSFQDLTAQRTRKVIEVLGFLESRVTAMVEIWQLPEMQEAVAAGREQTEPVNKAAAMSQADVDSVLVDPAPAARIEPAVADHDDDDEMLFVVPEAARPTPAPPPGERLQLVSSQPEPQPKPQPQPQPVAAPETPAPVDEALRKLRAGTDLSAAEATRALDALNAMSVEERTRLFS